MKTLILLRHAKSSWNDPDLSDFDRPLNKRGLKAAPLIGTYLRRKKIQPDLVLSSPAERARETANLVIEHAAISSQLRFDERIYAASATQLLTVVSQIEDSASVALLVGHNPGFEDLLSVFTGHARHMSTAALAYLTLEIEKWSEAREHCGKLGWMVKPKDLE